MKNVINSVINELFAKKFNKNNLIKNPENGGTPAIENSATVSTNTQYHDSRTNLNAVIVLNWYIFNTDITQKNNIKFRLYINKYIFK